MELFPAASEDQWTWIKRVIDDCDYYVVIVGGKYGSMDADGTSYTEKEYRYALDQDKHIIAFLHKDPGSLSEKLTEREPSIRDKLESFRTLIQSNKLCRYWISPSDLGAVVSRSLVQLIRTHPAVGWVRADLVPDESSTEEILRLRKQVETLEGRLNSIGKGPPPGAEHLAQGDDKFSLEVTGMVGGSNQFSAEVERRRFEVSVSWAEIFRAVSPRLIGESSDCALRQKIESMDEVVGHCHLEITESKDIKDKRLHRIYLSDECFQTIKVQLRSLGLIAKSSKQHSLKDRETYWTLTPYGDSVMTQLRAIPRK